MTEIIFRLINDGKVVGYEKHEGGRIYHCQPCADNKYLPFAEMDILTLHFDNGKEWYHPYYIPHTDKHRWTGLKYDGGRLMFERDKVEFCYRYKETFRKYKGIIKWCNINPSFMVQGIGVDKNKSDYDFVMGGWAMQIFLGIEGVDDKGEE